jgi:hypothetical protein
MLMRQELIRWLLRLLLILIVMLGVVSLLLDIFAGTDIILTVARTLGKVTRGAAV